MNKYLNDDIWRNPKILRHKDILYNDRALINVEIELSKVCNHRCVFCHPHGEKLKHLYTNQDTKGNSFFPSKRLFCLIDELKEVGAKSVSLPGYGEPLLHKDIFSVIKKLHEYDMDIGLTTNLSKKLNDDEIKVLGLLSWIRCSINGSNKEIHQKVHNSIDKDSFNNVVDNLKRLRKNKDLLIDISFLICEENKNDIVGIYNLAKEMSVNSLSYRPGLIGFDRRETEYEKVVIDSLNQVKEMDNGSLNINTGMHRFNDCGVIKEDIKCYISKYSLFITTNGDIFPCCITQCDTKYKYDNIMNKSFVEFWNSDNQKEHYKTINMRTCPLCRHTTDNMLLRLVYNEDGLVNNFI
jgi:radical SAM protein with 4Fe4S-binding SPASM domain